MKAVVFGVVVAGLALAIAACGGGGAMPSAPSVPVAPPAASEPGGPGHAATLAPTPADEVAYAESAGVHPDGFEPKFRVTPRAGQDGVIRGTSPLAVTFDLCGSTASEGQAPQFLFDWDFDHVADVLGTGDVCRQTHRFSVPSGQGGREQALRANVCVANGDARTRGTYVSCRSYAIAIPTPSPFPPGCGLFFDDGFLECLRGRVLHEDEGNDGSFEQSWFLSLDTTVGEGECPPGSEYDGVEVGDYVEIDPEFYAFMRRHGFEDTNDFCELD